MKKGDISVYLIFSVLITLAAIILVFVLIGRNSDMGKKIYCKSMYKKDGSDQFCDEYLNIEVNTLTRHKAYLEKFSDNRDIVFMKLDSSNSHLGNSKVKLPRNALIENASLKIRLAENKLIFFGSGNREEIIIFPTRIRIDKELPLIPSGTKISSARMEVSGAEYPTKSQVIFITDTSASMANEWAALCSILESAEQSILDLGLDIRTYVYGMASGTTAGSCIENRVEEADIESVTPLVPFDTTPAASVAPYDQASEAWAPASGWLAANFDEWDYSTDNKRIIIPISDSDPTGGGQTSFNVQGKPTGEASFTGNEAQAVDDAVGLATADALKWVYILPITGDDSPPPEGYGVGDPNCGSIPLCTEVMGYMNDIAGRTNALSSGAQVVGFKEPETIRDQIVKIMTTPFPSDIDIYIEGDHIFNFPGKLDDSNSPELVSGQEFVDAINSNGCVGRPSSCRIGVMSENGTVLLQKLAIRYVQDPHLVSITIGGVSLPVTKFSSLSEDNIEVEIDLRNELQEALENCPEENKYCEMPIEIKSSTDGSIELTGLNINYEYFDIEQEILEKAISCWKYSNEGNLQKNVLCDEITVGNIFEYNYPITEKGITELIKKKNFCHIFENRIDDQTGEDTGCGEEDHLEFEQDIYDVPNILIEYNSEDNKIIVS